MKITIELSDQEVKGIKAYLKEVDGIEKPNKADIKSLVDSYVAAMYAPHEAVAHYINQTTNQIIK